MCNTYKINKMNGLLYEPIQSLLAAQHLLDEHRVAYIRENLQRVEQFTIGAETILIPRLTLTHSGAMEIRSAQIEMNVRTTPLRRQVIASAPNGEKRTNVSMSIGTVSNNEQLEKLLVLTTAAAENGLLIAN
jgi:hypothetical protein